MEYVVLIALGVAALLDAIRRILDKSKKKSVWLLEIAIGIIFLLVAGFRLFSGPEPPPLTKQDIKEVLCEWDPYKEKISELAAKDEISQEEKRELKEAADCLAGIAVTSMDSGLVAIGLSRYSEAITHLTYAVLAAQDDSSKVEAYFYRGVAFGRWGDSLADPGNQDSASARYGQAVASYDSALAYKHDLNEAWYNRGTVLFKMDLLAQAAASFDSAIAYKHDYNKAWYNRGNALFELGDYENAVASFDSALTYTRDDHAAWSNRGLALDRLGRYEEAVASYDSALMSFRQGWITWHNRCITFAHLSSYRNAVESCDSALGYKWDFPEAWCDRGAALANLGQYSAALASCDSALAYKHDYPEAWNNRGTALWALNRYLDALASCDSALKYDPDYAEAAELRKAILEKMKE